MSTYPVLDAYSLVRREIGLLKSIEMKALDFGPKQMMILYRLSISSATMGEIAEYTLSDKASTSRAVTSLESAGLVKRVNQEGDRRVTVIELTSKGKTKAAKAIEIRDFIGKRFSSILDSSEQKQLAHLLNKVGQGLRDQRQK